MNPLAADRYLKAGEEPGLRHNVVFVPQLQYSFVADSVVPFLNLLFFCVTLGENRWKSLAAKSERCVRRTQLYPLIQQNHDLIKRRSHMLAWHCVRLRGRRGYPSGSEWAQNIGKHIPIHRDGERICLYSSHCSTSTHAA